MDAELIVKCGICGNKILYQGKKCVASEEICTLLSSEGVHQDGALFWHSGEVYPAKQSESDVNAFLREELVHKITLITEIEVSYYSCGSGAVYVPTHDMTFRFDKETTESEALGEALDYLVAL